MSEYCEIRVKGELDERWAEWFAGLQLTRLEGDGTLISGVLPDQAAIYGVLERLRDLNLILISVACGAPAAASSSQAPHADRP